MVSGPLDLLDATAFDLQHDLDEGKFTSVDLVKRSLEQIERFDKQGPSLRALVSMAPRDKLLEIASELDNERQSGHVRGPFHGLPIVIKDIINAHPDLKLPTTQGSAALLGAEYTKGSVLVSKLREAGFIIIGKGNISEFGASKGEKSTGGLSYLGGQSRSAYVPGGSQPDDEPFARTNPGGSSTGSALAVAAGYAPVSIGGEAYGSITTPASRSALYSIECTPRTINSEGIFLIVPTFESIGGIAKSVPDLTHLTKVILSAASEPRELRMDLPQAWDNMKLGFVEPGKWKLPDKLFASDPAYLRQIRSAYEAAIDEIQSMHADVQYPVSVPHPSEIKYKGDDGKIKIFLAEMRNSMNEYLATLEQSQVRSLEDIIEFNKNHPELQAGLDQLNLIQAHNDTTTPEELDDARKVVLKSARDEGLIKILDDLGLHAIAAPTDSPISTLAALAGCPSASVPLGYLEPSGRPFGLSFIAHPFREDTLLQLLGAFEATFPKRRLPPLLYRVSGDI
ncbi:amidase signature domain-containing protein [Lophiotrema nucula]|uniref:Amidase signature domain-containing protein n=1 Tax=Lophiotrema nucula TaxID=690887 RepID=A0A6A5YN22_9PLEO|nr:amidase signature domain-containing protein [Lophiotrema nucula]